MNSNQTIDNQKQMRLETMAQFHARYIKNNQYAQCTPDGYLALLTDHEWEERQNKNTQRLLKQAGVRQKASIAEVSYIEGRNLDKNMFDRISTLDFIAKKENIIITEPSDGGKSYLSQAMGHQTCLPEMKVIYTNTARLFTRLKLAKVDGIYLKEIYKLYKTDLLILDDFGLQAFDNFARETLLNIIDKRFNKCSTIVSSQLLVSTWYDIIGESTIADAILDRIVNSSHQIDLKGQSMRKGILKNK